MSRADARPPGPLRTIRRGLALSPELRTGLAGTLGLALIAMVGRVAVPIAVQVVIDRGLRASGGPDTDIVLGTVAAAVAVLVLTTGAQSLMMRRLFTVTESALATVRSRTFRHIHDLSMLHQQGERRGALTSRVTTDVDQVTQFLQVGGVTLLVSAGQIVVTSVVMFVYSWQLALVVYASFLPLVIIVRLLQRRLARTFLQVRERVGVMLAAIAETVVGADVIRAYGVADRSARRLDDAIEQARAAQLRGMRISIKAYSIGEIAAGLAMAGVVLVGTLLGVGGGLQLGELTAFLLLVQLFVAPVQVATDVLNEAQNAVAGWRRVLDVLDVEPDVRDPGQAGQDLPPGPVAIDFEHVSFAYPDDVAAHPPGPTVLADVDIHIAPRTRVAVVGETGSGKTTFAKLLTRLMDPTDGTVRLSGIGLRDVRFSSLRRRVVLVPQDGFLFDATIAENIRFADASLADAAILDAFAELGLADWVETLPLGLATPVGERGEALSVGERQLVALVRAYVADPDLLVLDEATSAVDPATELRLQRALDAVTRGRTTVAIAHRLSTAQAADEIIVFDRGKIVQRGPHAELVTREGAVYSRLHAAWVDAR
jgi:ABC-type multidrug transport system fused ATPase/permease subunit